MITPGYRYKCLKCETRAPVRKTLEEAQGDQTEHRQDAHSGMEPIAGDPITEDEYAREPAPAPVEDEPPAPAAERPVQTWEWLVVGFIVLVVLNVLFGK